MYGCRRIYLLLLTFVLGACAGPRPVATIPPAPQDAPTGPSTSDRLRPYPVELPPGFAEAVAAGTRTTTGLPGPAYWQQEADYDLTARLFPEEKRLDGSGRIVYRNNSPDTLFTLHLELVQNLHREGGVRNVQAEVTGGLQVRRLVVNGQELRTGLPRGARYVVSGTQLVIVPERPVPPGATTEIQAEWTFQVPQEGASGRMGHSQDNLFFIAYWYPIMSVYDDVLGWQTDQFLGQSEFYAGFGDYDVTVEAPEGWVVMATGELLNAEEVLAPDVLARMRRAHQSDEPVQVIGSEHFGRAATRSGTDGRLRWRFEADRVRDFAFSATSQSYWEAARTPVGDRDGDGTVDYARINTFWRASAPLWAEVTRYQQHAITFLSRYTGLPYPWPHMTAVEGSGIIGGGMEFPMMTLIGDYNNAGPEALYNVTAHELAHMWIPMIVATDERRYSWIDEGSTTFAENQARIDRDPGDNANLQDQMTYLQVARQGLEGEIMRRSNYHYPPYAYAVASYPKPATLLWALRGLLGEETFLRAYRSFIESWAYKHPYPHDLFNTFERVSGRDLDWFWQSWYFQTWTLDQAVTAVRPGAGGTTIVVEDQGRVPMPVRLAITLASGETLRREIPVETWLAGATQATLTVETASPVVRVEIDPESYFPDIDRTDNVWTR